MADSQEPLGGSAEFIGQVTRGQRRLYAFIYSLVRHAADAEDVLQATNLILWQKSGEFVPGTDFMAGACRIAPFQVLAFRMQDAVPAVMDFSRETRETLDLYGIGSPPTDGFGRQCLLARRFAEAGVRFIEVGRGSWDQHNNLKTSLQENADETDRPIAGLLADLKGRGLLEDTLVLWGGEFGRTPHSPDGNGRDHNGKGYTLWMAGGGVMGGLAFGSTDEHGYEAVEDKVHVHDWHATILHLLGLDHERLTFRHASREMRLTDVHGRVVKEILA